MSMDKCRLHIFAHSLRHNSQFFGLFQPVASVRTRFHCFRFLAPTFCTPFSSSTGMRIPCRSGFFLSCHQSGWDSSTTIFPSVSLTKSQSLTSLLPHEWSRQEQIDYTTEYIQKTFVDKGMCADWSIHDKNDGNPHVHLLVTMRPFNPDHS